MPSNAARLSNSGTTETGTVTLIDNNSNTVNIGSAFAYVGQNTTPQTTMNFPVVVANEPAPLAPPITAPPTIIGSYTTADGTATAAENDYAPAVTGSCARVRQ